MSALIELSIGAKLPELRKTVTQEHISLYAKASGDFNPIHIDPEFAKTTPAGGTIAHGMLILAYVSELMTVLFGRDWLERGSLNVRFKAPARPGDTIAVSGAVESIDHEKGRDIVKCSVLCANQKGEIVITGETQIGVEKS